MNGNETITNGPSVNNDVYIAHTPSNLGGT